MDCRGLCTGWCLWFAVGLAAAGSAGSGAPIDVTVAVLDGFGRD